MLFYLLLSILLIMITSLAGIIFMWHGLGPFLEKRSHLLTTFAGGVFAVLAFTLVQETTHLSESILLVLSSIVLGILVISLFTRLFPDEHHHHTLPPHCEKKHSPIDARRVLWSDAFHNIGDGILLVSAFTLDIRIGIAAAIGIFLHELVQEISEFFVLREAGYTTKKALVYNFLISSTIFIGAFIALIASSVDILIAPLLGFAAGGFLFVLLHDLLPHAIHSARHTRTWNTHIFAFALGVAIMFSINAILPHSHEEDDHGHESATHEDSGVLHSDQHTNNDHEDDGHTANDTEIHHSPDDHIE